jgi:hypothetical protein
LNKSLRHIYSLGLILFSLIVISCGTPGGKSAVDTGELIAEYNQHKLFREEVDFFTPQDVSAEDSARFAKKYIHQWIRQQAIAEVAYNRIPDLDEKIRFKLSDYEQKLVNYEFSGWLIQNRLDTIVSDIEIRTFYNQNSDQYISKTNYYGYFFVRTQKANQFQLVGWLKGKEPEDIRNALEWSKANATEFRLDSTYVTDSEIERISKGYYGNIRRARPGLVYSYQSEGDSSVNYNYFKMIKAINPGDRLPVSVVREQIRLILLNQRKKQLIERTEADLVEQARINNAFTIHVK